MSVRKRLTEGGQVRWLVDYRDGGGVRRFKQFPRKRDADQFNIKARGEIAAGTHTADAASITVKAAADLWLARCDDEELERTTIDGYRQHVELHIVPAIGAVKLSRLSVPAVNAFRDRLRDAGCSRDMIKRVTNSLAALVDEAQARGLVAVNNVRVTKRTRAKRGRRPEAPRPVMPTREELRAIIAATANHPKPLGARAFILTAMLAGLRGSELRGLQWGDVDFATGQLHVRRRVDRYNKFGPPKSEAGTRDIPMAPLLANTLKQWRLICPKGELSLVFPTGAGMLRATATCSPACSGQSRSRPVSPSRATARMRPAITPRRWTRSILSTR
jgi:integrase